MRSQSWGSRSLRGWAVIGAAAALTLSPFAPVALGAAGDLDPTFSADGRVTTDLGQWELGHDLALQPDGKIVVVGESRVGNYSGYSTNAFAIARYDGAGVLDPTFSDDGRETTLIAGPNSYARAVALQSDGKLVVVGGTGPSPGDFAVARYLPEGALDTGFSDDGWLATDFGFWAEEARAVEIQADGKIIVAGHTFQGGGGVFALARYDSDGVLDPTFAGDGRLTTSFDFAATAQDLVVQPDGRIVVAGGSYYAGGHAAIARYEPDGALDLTFSDDGRQAMDFPGEAEEAAFAVGLQSDGRIVLAGRAAQDLAVARLNADGSPDLTFSDDGIQTTDFGSIWEQALDVSVQSDGKIVTAGRTGDGSWTYQFALARYNFDGSLDPTFSADGILTTSFGSKQGTGAAAVAVQPDGKILAAGDYNGDFAVARYQGVDTTPPNTSIDSGTWGPISDANAAFTFWSTEPGSTFECRLDSEPFAPCTSPVAVGPVTHGKHTFEVRATDISRYTDPTPAERTFNFVTCTIIGTEGADTLLGTALSDVICGFGGNDVLRSFDGNDILVGGAGSDRLFAGAGVDVLGGNDDDDTLDGGLGADSFFGGFGSDRVTYVDRVTGVTATIDDAANDGEPGELDNVHTDIERIRGGSGNDLLVGDGRANLLTGGPGNDVLRGGAGNDTLEGLTGADVLQGDSGKDVAVYAERANAVTVTIGVGADDGEPGEGDDVSGDVEVVRGGRGDDTLTGSPLADVLDGRLGNDTLDGGAGPDQLIGGAGEDRLLARDGERDTVNCGPDLDTMMVDSIDRVAADCEIS